MNKKIKVPNRDQDSKLYICTGLTIKDKDMAQVDYWWDEKKCQGMYRLQLNGSYLVLGSEKKEKFMSTNGLLSEEMTRAFLQIILQTYNFSVRPEYAKNNKQK